MNIVSRFTGVSLSPAIAHETPLSHPLHCKRSLEKAVLWCTAWLAMACAPGLALATPAQLPNPVVFVTQVPIPVDFATVTSVIGGQAADMASSGRGGDLWIRYPDGTQRNLTEQAGYGNSGLQGANAIGVRDPSVDWTGTKVIFSMVVGAPVRYQWNTYYWQLYEVTGLGEGGTATITKVPNQPANANNIQGTYTSDGSIVFASDQPRDGQPNLYPQLDEYESVPSLTGLWKLGPGGTGPAVLLENSPSGSFTPFVDSFGRIIFTRWDHLQRDQQADAGTHGAFNWSSEAPNAVPLNTDVEVFPEPRMGDPTTNEYHDMNHFFPWALNQDGTHEETINHIGRHELFQYFNFSLKADPNLIDFQAPAGKTVAEDWLQLAEDPLHPGRYIGIDAPEFYTHASGQIVALTAPLGVPADQLPPIEYLTPQSTGEIYYGPPPADFSGRYRNAIPMSNGTMLAAYSSESGQAENTGTPTNPESNYMFRLYTLATGSDGYLHTSGAPLTQGISKSISYYNPNQLVTYDGVLWELSPVEIRAKPVPPLTSEPMEAPETQAFAEANVNVSDFQNFLAARGLGVLVSRNVTSRDDADCQQPYNLRVPGGVETVGSYQQPSCSANPNIHGNPTLIYDIPYLQFFQGDLIRGYGGYQTPGQGRRVLAQPLHDAASLAFMPPPPAGAPAGSVAIASDGSAAAIVPAQRAMAWQTTQADGTPVVRERYWITVKPGEIRACDSCHGVNTLNQAGQPPPQNTPQALIDLVTYWNGHHDVVFDSGFD
jgi:hypothetical protein